MNIDSLQQLHWPVLLAISFFVMVVYLVVKGLICYLVVRSLQRVPPEYRKIEPAMIWLLMIPCFSLVWNFFVFRRVPASFEAYFNAQGHPDGGDCGKTLGTWYASLCVVAVAIPLYGTPAGIAALVLLIMSLVKYNDLKQRIERSEKPPATLPPGSGSQGLPGV